MRRFPQPEPAEHNHYNGPRPNYPPLTKAELEVRLKVIVLPNRLWRSPSWAGTGPHLCVANKGHKAVPSM